MVILRLKLLRHPSMAVPSAIQVDPVHAEALSKWLPSASLRIIEEGGHFAYWVCNSSHQKQALTQLLRT